MVRSTRSLFMVLMAFMASDGGAIINSENSNTFHSQSLTQWGGGWRALYRIFNFKSSTQKIPKDNFFPPASLQQKFESTQELDGHMGVGADSLASEPAVPTIALPSWAKWCLVKPCDGSKMFYMATYSQNDIVSAFICKTGVWELCDAGEFAGRAAKSLISAKTKSLIRADEAEPLAIDIGGNIGYYSLLLANAGWNVVTVEPLPMNTQLIEASLKQNPDMQSRLHLHKVGLAASGGGQCAVISDTGNVGDGHVGCFATSKEVQTWIGQQNERNLRRKDQHTYQIRGQFPMSTLNDLIQQEPFLKHKSVGFVKMDVEGFEGEVIKGGHSLLSDYKPRKIRSEVWQDMHNMTPLDFLSMFATAGYAISKEIGARRDWACDNADDAKSMKAKVDMMFAREDMIDVQMCLVSQVPALTELGGIDSTRTLTNVTVHDPKVPKLMRVESHGAVHKLHHQ